MPESPDDIIEATGYGMTPTGRAAERALAVLNAFHADKPAMTLGEIATSTGLYKSTILRLAGCSSGLGYLVRGDNGGAFRLGPALCVGIDLPRRIIRSAKPSGRNCAGWWKRPAADRGIVLHSPAPIACVPVRPGTIRPHRASPPRRGCRLAADRRRQSHVLVAFADGKGAKADAVKTRGYAISLGERDPQVAAVASRSSISPASLRVRWRSRG